MRRLLGGVVSLYFLLPLAVLAVLVGLAVGWWVVAAGLALFALFAIPTAVAVRRIRTRIAQDIPLYGEREALNRELRRQDRWNIREGKWLAIGAACICAAAALLTLALVAAEALS